jgi:hypothetical protein
VKVLMLTRDFTCSKNFSQEFAEIVIGKGIESPTLFPQMCISCGKRAWIHLS